MLRLTDGVGGVSKWSEVHYVVMCTGKSDFEWIVCIVAIAVGIICIDMSM